MARSKFHKPKHMKVFMELMAEQGCILSGDPAQLHHIRTPTNRKSDRFIIPLSPYYHTDGPKGVAIHKGKFEFESLRGSQWDLYDQALDYVLRRLIK
jgi:hypothetical protein